MVAGGAGVTLLPRLTLPVENRRSELAVRRLASPEPHRTLALVWRPRSPLGPALRRLAQTIRDACVRRGAARGASVGERAAPAAGAGAARRDRARIRQSRSVRRRRSRRQEGHMHWHWAWILPVANWSIRLWAIWAVPRRRSPNAARAWLLLIVLLPIPGFALYSIFGRAYLPSRRRERQARGHRSSSATPRRVSAFPARRRWRTRSRPPRTWRSELGAFPVVGGNRAELIDDYETSIDRLVADIDAAHGERAPALLHLRAGCHRAPGGRRRDPRRRPRRHLPRDDGRHGVAPRAEEARPRAARARRGGACRCSPRAPAGPGATCATTGRSPSSTGGWATRDPRTSSTPSTTRGGGSPTRS